MSFPPVIIQDPGLSVVKAFGADPIGTVDSTQALLNAFQTGGRIWVPDGDYLIAAAGAAAGGVYATLTKSLHVTCSPRARFFTNGLDHDMIRIGVPSNGAGLPARKISVIWESGLFDQSSQKGSTSMPYTSVYPGGGSAGVGSSATCDGLSVRGSYTSGGTVYGAFDLVRISGARFYSGTHWQTAGGDSNIYAGDGADELEIDCWHQGSRDVAVYVSRDGTGAAGNCARVRGNYTNCFYGQAFKRGFRQGLSSGYYSNCVGGVTVNHVAGGQTSGVIVEGTFDGCQQAVRADYATDVSVRDILVTGMGATLADGVTALDTSLGNPLGVIFNGCTESNVRDSKFVGFNAAYNKTICQGVLLDSWTDAISGTVNSTYIDVCDNQAVGLHTIGAETAMQADYNRWLGNRLIGCDLAGASLSGANSVEVRWNETYHAPQYQGGILVGDGSTTQASLARAADPTSGFSFGTGTVYAQVGGSYKITVTATAVTLGAVLAAPVGTAAAPGMAFGADLTTGIFRAGTGKLGLAAGGIEVLEAAANGLTVISTAAPTVNPATGKVILYVDPADNKLKTRGSSGTITTLALP